MAALSPLHRGIHLQRERQRPSQLSSANLLHRCQPLSAIVPQPSSSCSQPQSRRQEHWAGSTGRSISCRAAVGAAEPESERSSVFALAALALLFVGWYGSNIYFNIYNKQLLKLFPFPLTATNLQFFIGSCLSAVFWITGLVKLPSREALRETLPSLAPLAAIHVLGNVLTNVSLGAVAVSFTHTVKAMEPFFSVIMSAIFLGDVPPPPVLLTLVPIVGGVVLASVTEATFNWVGFLSAMASNITFQSRNVLSKKLMLKKGGMSNMNMFQVITICAFFMLAPITLAVEGTQFLPSALAARGIDEAMRSNVYMWLAVAGVCFHAYQQLSYMILGRVMPVTHSIGNCVKRVVVIVSSVIIFKNPMSTQNAIGTALALSGVFLYSQVKRAYSSKAKA